ncbi:MAG TPA: FtsX-like permease family protein [Gemmataceae bacterium]|nr:FtsX-like permease family protein [Gemmataceae bacterium]
MSLWRLITREILYRKLNFALAVLSVLVAAGCLVAELTLLRSHDLQTAAILAQKEAEVAARMKQVEEETAARMRQVEDDYRKIALKLGFNILILPKDQNLSDLYADDFASRYMPEDYVERLARAGVVTINHLLPSLQQKLKWPEQERTIILMGVRGEVPILHQVPKKPLLQPVPPGTVVVGHELHRSLKLKKGDRIKLLGREFTVHQLQPERGNKDDITLWINLREAQELLDRPGQINAILALECNCSDDRLAKVREEIAGILPDTQVIEFASQALTRAEARNRAAALAQQERAEAAALAAKILDDEKTARARLRQEQEAFAHVLVPLVLAGCIVWIGVLAFNNVRERQVEIGILRALGLRAGHVFALFLTKAVLVGLVGAAIGYLAGSLIGTYWGEAPAGVRFDPSLLVLVLAAAPVLAALASWVPALLAARQDPAVVLREE